MLLSCFRTTISAPIWIGKQSQLVVHRVVHFQFGALERGHRMWSQSSNWWRHAPPFKTPKLQVYLLCMSCHITDRVNTLGRPLIRDILLNVFWKFPRLVGRYCSYLLPKKTHATHEINITKYQKWRDAPDCMYALWPAYKVHSMVEKNWPQQQIETTSGHGLTYTAPFGIVR